MVDSEVTKIVTLVDFDIERREVVYSSILFINKDSLFKITKTSYNIFYTHIHTKYVLTTMSRVDIASMTVVTTGEPACRFEGENSSWEETPKCSSNSELSILS